MLKAFCDWCGEEVASKAVGATGPQKRVIKQETVLQGVDTQQKVEVSIELTTGDGQHICGLCSARAIAAISDHLEGPEPPPYGRTDEVESPAEAE